MTKKKIGIVGMSFNDNRHFGASTNYLQFINMFGTPHIIMPGEKDINCDVLLLAGGQDLNPSVYGSVPEYKTTNANVFQQHFFDHLLDKYIDSGMPIYGICLGFQSLLAKFGYKLVQDMPFHPQSNSRWGDGHEVTITENGLQYLEKAVSAKKYKVNSHHHQGVLVNPLDQDIDVLAYYNDYSGPIIEAFKHKHLPIAGFQGHPEEFYDELSVNLFKSILE